MVSLACKNCGCTDRYNEVCSFQQHLKNAYLCNGSFVTTARIILRRAKITEPTEEQLAEMKLKQGSEISHMTSYFENKKTQDEGVAKCPN